MGYKVTTRSKSNPLIQDQRTLTMFEEFELITSGKRKLDSKNQSSPSKVNAKKLKKEGSMVKEIVNSIKEELQAWSIPAIVSREQFMTDCWMKNSLELVKNAKLASTMNIKNDPETGEEVRNKIQMKIREPAQNSLLSFWNHPSSSTIWRTSRLLQIQPNDQIWENWWQKIQNDYKGMNPQYKLEKYLTALDYFNQLMVNFWSKVAFNLTMMSQESLVSDITRMGDFLKLGGLDLTFTEALFKLAEDIAINKPIVGEIRKKLEKFWPANMNIASFHYNEPKFEKVLLDGPIDGVDAKATAKLKNFKFEPQIVWPEEEIESTPNVSINPNESALLAEAVASGSHFDAIEQAGPSGINKSLPFYQKLLDELE